jgi:hypothetical protein
VNAARVEAGLRRVGPWGEGRTRSGSPATMLRRALRDVAIWFRPGPGGSADRRSGSSRRHTADRGGRISAAGRRLGGGAAGSGGPGAGIYRAGTWFGRTTRRAAAQSLAGFDASAGDADADVVGASRGPAGLSEAAGTMRSDRYRQGARRLARSRRFGCRTRVIVEPHRTGAA